MSLRNDWTFTMKNNNDKADIIEQLRELGFCTPREEIDALFRHAIKHRLGPIEIAEKLAAMERRERDARNLARRTSAAKLGTVTPREQFDWNHPEEIDRPSVERLLTVQFVQAGHNVLLRGGNGVGKTTLAKYMGFEALNSGYTVRFCTFAEMLADLLKQESLPALERRLKRYTTPQLLIIDEIGYLPCDPQAADLLFNIVTRRHEARSTVITTNLPFKRWGTLFDGAASVSALIDRFAQHCYTIDIKADSWRHKHAISRSSPKPSGLTDDQRPSSSEDREPEL